MITTDVKTLTRMAVAEALGTTYMTEHGYLEEIPADKLVDVGKDITDGEFTVEKYTKALSVLLARREIYADDFKPFYDDIMLTREEWGGFIERDYIDFADIMDDPALTLVDGTSYATIEHTFYQPKVSSKIYEEGKGIMIPISIQRAALTESFRGYDEMSAYIAKIRTKVRATLKMALDRYAAILVEAGIAVSAKATNTAVYLLSEAYAEGIDGITASATTPEEALNNPAFLRFMAAKMEEIRDNMKATTAVYTNGNRAVASYDNTLYMLSKVANKLKFNLYSGTYNRNDVTLDYKKVPMWQAVADNAGAKFDFDTVSTVAFAADNKNKLGLGTGAVTVERVAAFLFDKRAIGMTVFKENTTNSYTACADFWNEFIHSLTNQLLDSDFPMVAFILDYKPTSSEQI